MLVKHKSNKSFMFYTSTWLKKFYQWKCELNKQEVEEIKKTLDYKYWNIEIKKIEEIKKVKKEVKKEVKTKSKKKK